MPQAPGAQQNPIYCMLASGLNVSFDGGATWAAAVSIGEIPLATPSAAGLMSAADKAKLPGASTGIVQEFFSAATDLTATQTAVVVVPALPGFFLAPIASNYVRILNVTKGGTVSTAGNLNMGNDAGHINMLGNTANLTAALWTPGPRNLGTLLGNAAQVLIDLSAPIVFDVTVAATGSAPVWTAMLGIAGALIPSF